MFNSIGGTCREPAQSDIFRAMIELFLSNKFLKRNSSFAKKHNRNCNGNKKCLNWQNFQNNDSNSQEKKTVQCVHHNILLQQWVLSASVHYSATGEVCVTPAMANNLVQVDEPVLSIFLLMSWQSLPIISFAWYLTNFLLTLYPVHFHLEAVCDKIVVSQQTKCLQ